MVLPVSSLAGCCKPSSRSFTRPKTRSYQQRMHTNTLWSTTRHVTVIYRTWGKLHPTRLSKAFNVQNACGCTLRQAHFYFGLKASSATNRPGRISPSQPTRHRVHTSSPRLMSWFPKLNLRSNDQFDGPSDGLEEVTKVAILEKAMKGRQPTDLMLRCM